MSAEPPPVFVDTNILVYALASDDSARATVAQALLRDLMAAKSLRTSTQVIQETYVTLTRKGRFPLTAPQALRYIDDLAIWPVFNVDLRAIRSAIDLSSGAQLSFWDALVVVAATRSGAKRLYTEDLNHGQVIMGVEVVNPFLPKDANR